MRESILLECSGSPYCVLKVIFVFVLILQCFTTPTFFIDAKPVKHQRTSTSQNDFEIHPEESRLAINVRNNGGEVFREVIRSNVEQNWIDIEFRETDGSLVKQIIDFRNKLQIFLLTRLGEQDLGEQRVQAFCFVVSLGEHEYITSESMSKLTQRNPAAIRQAEYDVGSIQLAMDVEIVMDDKNGTSFGRMFSEHIAAHCSDARVYGTENDLRKWSTNIDNGNRRTLIENLSAALRPLDSFDRKSEVPLSPTNDSSNNNTNGSARTSSIALRAQNVSDNLSNSVDQQRPPPFSGVTSRRCGDLLQSIYRNLTTTTATPTTSQTSHSIDFRHFQQDSNGHNSTSSSLPPSLAQCQCSMSLVVPFYPCGIKYCTDPKNPQSTEKFRCGIKTCRRRYDFLFTVNDKLSCLASFDPTALADSPSAEDSSLNDSISNVVEDDVDGAGAAPADQHH